MIPQTTCPDSYLQLLSLRNEPDGFIILRNFTFLGSPQLDGKFRDFQSSINNLIIHPGEHLRTFYSRATWLSNEITLANLQDRTLAVLHERFLALLRDTKCHLIIGETSQYWRQIKEHQRDPTNLTADLPWTFTTILRTLETVGVSTLSSSPSDTHSSPTLIPSYAASSYSDPSLDYINAILPPFAASSITSPLSTHHNHYHSTTSPLPYKNNKSTHHSSPKRVPSSPPPNHTRPSHQQIKEKRLLCKLCNNLHSSPWHTTAMCPLKDPTFIVSKTICENVMQHNNLFGKTNKNYNKNIDLPTAHSKPSKAIIPSHAHSATTTPFDPPYQPDLQAFDPYAAPMTTLTDPSATPVMPLEDPNATYDISLPTLDSSPTDDIINTSTFDVPIPPSANLCTSTSDHHPASAPFVDLIFDPTEYLHFSS
jgi:hypothetical protein